MPRRRKPVLVTIEAQPYGSLVTVICGATDRQLRTLLRAAGLEPDNEDIEELDVSGDEGRTYPIEEGHLVVRYRDRAPSVDVVTHESLHATARVMWRAGIEFSEATEEAYAYLLDSIVKQTWSAAGN